MAKIYCHYVLLHSKDVNIYSDTFDMNNDNIDDVDNMYKFHGKGILTIDELRKWSNKTTFFYLHKRLNMMRYGIALAVQLHYNQDEMMRYDYI